MENNLITPRYQVIADYPDSSFKEGAIITTRYGGACGQVADVYMSVGDNLIIHVDDYPHLFRELHWSENRSIEEMPEYVFDILHKRVGKAQWDTYCGCMRMHGEHGTLWGLIDFKGRIEPATVADFEAYKNSQQKTK